jgi:hypothetical protein
MQGRMENPAVREAAFAALRADWESGVPLNLQKTVEHQLQLSAESADLFVPSAEEMGSIKADAEVGAKFRKAQQARARKPRRIVTDDRRTLIQVIEDFVSKPELHEHLTREMWPPFFSELERLDLSPEEPTHPDDLRKSAYTYTDDLKGNQRKITYGRFANIVSSVRQGKKSR